MKNFIYFVLFSLLALSALGLQSKPTYSHTFKTFDSENIIDIAFLDAASEHLILLLRDKSNSKPAQVFVTSDFGANYVNKTESLRFMTDGSENAFNMPEDDYALIEYIAVNPYDEKNVVLADRKNKLLFVSEDYGVNFSDRKLTFTPTTVTFHKYQPYFLIVFDEEENEVMFSGDFGINFSPLQNFVKEFFIVGEPDKTTLYFERMNIFEHNVLAADVFEINHEMQVNTAYDNELYANVTEWQVRDEVLFVTHQLPDGKYGFSINPGLKKSTAVKAEFIDDPDMEFDENSMRHFYLVDAVKDEYILVTMRRNNSNACNLYRARFDFLDYSYRSTLKFYLVLENVFCHYPKSTWTEDLIMNVYAMESFVDIYKVEGMSGTYIASVMNKEDKNKEYLMEDMIRSLITWDYGGHWFLLTAPKKTRDGSEYYCHISQGCSLHLSQKYALINPFLRHTQILSSASAPGLIIATGSVGKSLSEQGHGVFMSRDGGVTWNHLFDGNYVYNFGDSGGILVAIKNNKHNEPDGVIRYSIDYGHNWSNYSLYPASVQIEAYGLLNEDRKKSMFFLVPVLNKALSNWDLSDFNGAIAFANADGYVRPCMLPQIDSSDFDSDTEVSNVTHVDFHLWTLPSSHPEVFSDYVLHESHIFPYRNNSRIVGCILGNRRIYATRNADSKCAINDFENNIATKSNFFENTHLKSHCECNFEDLECDNGFKGNRTTLECDPIDPHLQIIERNEGCKKHGNYTPFAYYKKTGIRLIPQDQCKDNLFVTEVVDPIYTECPGEIFMEAWNVNKFMIVAKDTEILRFDYLDKDVEPMITRIPLENLLRVVAIDYDMETNCLFYLDAEADLIMKSCENHNQILLHTGLWSVESIAYDWISDLLYFSSGKGQFIDALKTRYQTNWQPHHARKRILDSKDVVKPRSLAIDPNAGLMFWADWSTDESFIGRAELDGTSVRRIAVRPDVYWPNGIAVDYAEKRIVWVDAKLEEIVTCDYECSSTSKKTISGALNTFNKPFGIAVLDDLVIFDDWQKQELVKFKKDKDFKMTEPRIILTNTTGLTDIKCFASYIVKNNKTVNHCANSSCEGLCVNGAETHKCMCPDGLYYWEDKCVCPDYRTTMYDNGTCSAASCENSQTSFICRRDNVCIPKNWVCNGYEECSDGSDEMFCPELEENQKSQCNYNGKLVIGHYTCENMTDCPSAKDELFCDTDAVKEACAANQYMCDTDDLTMGFTCIGMSQICDGNRDCMDNSDETDCSYNVVETCEDKGLFSCYDNADNCYSEAEFCDGKTQCNNGIDEEGCIDDTCDLSSNFQCDDHKTCYPNSFKCDGFPDCYDETDELECDYKKEPSSTKKPENNPFDNPPKEEECVYPMALCANKKCILAEWFCDSITDCEDGSDEMNCPSTTTPSTTTTSTTTTTIAPNVIVPSTERNVDCTYGQFKCRSENKCISYYFRCDGEINCDDETDEVGCSAYEFAADDIVMFTMAENQTEITVGWFSVHNPLNDTVAVLPVIKKVSNVFGSDQWTNQSDWIENETGFQQFTFKNLKANTQYNISMRFLLQKSKQQFQAKFEIEDHTRESSNSNDSNIFNGSVQEVSTMNLKIEAHSSHLTVTWTPPIEEVHRIIGYELFYVTLNSTKAFSQQIRISDPIQTKLEVPLFFFKKGLHRYAFALLAEVSGMQSVLKSNVVDYTLYVPDNLQQLNMTLIERVDHEIVFEWSFDDQFESVAAVKMSILDVSNDQILKYIVDDEPLATHKVTVSKLSPGTSYAVYIKVYNYDSELIASKHLMVSTTGLPLPVVENVTISTEMNKRSVHFEWKKPQSARANDDKWIYGVFMATNVRDLYLGEVINTTSVSATIDNVKWCHNYFWSVVIIGPNGVGPFMKPLPILELKYNPLDAPLNIRIDNNKQNINEVMISWTPSCLYESKNMKYLVIVENLNTSVTYRFVVQSADSQHVVEVCFGTVYQAQARTFIAKDGIQSQLSDVTSYRTRAMPAPDNLQIERSSNKKLILTWTHSALANFKLSEDFEYNYIVELEGSETAKFETHEKILEIDLAALHVKSGSKIVFRVALKSSRGCLSDWAEIEQESLQETETSEFHIPITAIVLVFLVAIVAVVYFFVGNRLNLRTPLQFFKRSSGSDSPATPSLPTMTSSVPASLATVRGLIDEQSNAEQPPAFGQQTFSRPDTPRILVY